VFTIPRNLGFTRFPDAHHSGGSGFQTPIIRAARDLPKNGFRKHISWVSADAPESVAASIANERQAIPPQKTSFAVRAQWSRTKILENKLFPFWAD
jgi:hypothetical protein